MASSSGQSATGGKRVAEEFVGHRLLNRITHFPDPKDLPRPLDIVAYFEDEPPCQTTHCTNVAVVQYPEYNKQRFGVAGRKIKRAVGVDSNMLILDPNDPVSYWHVYFKGYVGRIKHKFFAELSGVKGPERLISCHVVYKASSVYCEHCHGGVYHPPGVHFKGSSLLSEAQH